MDLRRAERARSCASTRFFARDRESRVRRRRERGDRIAGVRELTRARKCARRPGWIAGSRPSAAVGDDRRNDVTSRRDGEVTERELELERRLELELELEQRVASEEEAQAREERVLLREEEAVVVVARGEEEGQRRREKATKVVEGEGGRPRRGASEADDGVADRAASVGRREACRGAREARGQALQARAAAGRVRARPTRRPRARSDEALRGDARREGGDERGGGARVRSAHGADERRARRRGEELHDVLTSRGEETRATTGRMRRVGGGGESSHTGGLTHSARPSIASSQEPRDRGDASRDGERPELLAHLAPVQKLLVLQLVRDVARKIRVVVRPRRDAVIDLLLDRAPRLFPLLPHFVQNARGDALLHRAEHVRHQELIRERLD
eukprot:31550-Pelagococcus_subviridis.AAC.25